MPLAHIDKSLYPIVIVTIQPLLPTEKSYNQFLDELKNLLLQVEDTKIVLVVDLKQAKALSPQLRLIYNNWKEENEALLKKKLMGHAIVNNITIANIFERWIYHLKKNMVPMLQVSRIDEALLWGEKKLIDNVYFVY